MINPLFDRKHIKEYLLFGLLSAIGYSIFVFLFLQKTDYNYMYLLYIGNIVFMFIIAMYYLILIKRPYDGRRAVAMLLAGHTAVLTGIVFSLVMIVIGVMLYFPDLFAYYSKDQIVENLPAAAQISRPSGLVFMLGLNAIVVNFGAAALLSIVFAYAGKRNQTKDKPAPLENQIPASTAVNG